MASYSCDSNYIKGNETARGRASSRASGQPTLIALRDAEKDQGRGQVVDVSLLEPLVSILGPDAALHKLTGKVHPRTGNRTSITAPRNAYETADHKWLVLSASTQRMTERLLEVIGKPEMNADPRFRTSAAAGRGVRKS